MSLGGPPESQLMLLPARTPAEASAWGSAAMGYAAAFQAVHFARDPERVDWRGYQRVTIIAPTSTPFWPEDLPLLIKQANPDAVIDQIAVETPEALQLILNVRVYYGWRYGPQTAFDWAQLWYALLRKVNGLGAAFAYLVSTPDPVESTRWAWRDEAGNDVGIASVVGARKYILR
ncbi:MAG: hypothetical protein ACRDH2_19530 [Anaerolineales bacterium]